ncbi:hypothetical protein A9G22_08035 [Gilliamella sp. App2-1]|uniref:hypothetical protein n=1 Tax=Gilliamella sp. App2-1 TaxID=3120230 RepID=UPI0008283365|nr:hypothetical protein [Gilliamella apicola]OCG22359.1 hypothetical protein A9G22_08035 [Gilliamella apicola]
MCTGFGVFTKPPYQITHSTEQKAILDNSQEWGVIDDETGELIDYGQFKRPKKKASRKTKTAKQAEKPIKED